MSTVTAIHFLISEFFLKEMMSCLITGAGGFVGIHLIEELKNRFGKIYGMGLPNESVDGIEMLYLDIREKDRVDSVIQSIRPDFVFHLAAQASVPVANEDPQGTLETNVIGTLNLLVSLSKIDKPVRFVYISSADVYGRQNADDYPLTENLIPNPLNPYSSSKYSAEIYCRQFANQFCNLQVIIARPFNHIGVGQRKIFVVPNFVTQVIEAKKNHRSEIFVGNLSAKRDFLDVKDVVSAYRILAEKGKNGEVYNISSGEEISIGEILEKIIQLLDAKISISIDRSRFREADTPRLLGSPKKLIDLGWKKTIEIDYSLRMIINSLQ